MAQPPGVVPVKSSAIDVPRLGECAGASSGSFRRSRWVYRADVRHFRASRASAMRTSARWPFRCRRPPRRRRNPSRSWVIERIETKCTSRSIQPDRAIATEKVDAAGRWPAQTISNRVWGARTGSPTKIGAGPRRARRPSHNARRRFLETLQTDGIQGRRHIAPRLTNRNGFVDQNLFQNVGRGLAEGRLPRQYLIEDCPE